MSTSVREPRRADSGELEGVGEFARRHIGPSETEIAEMLAFLGFGSIDELIAATVPASIRFGAALPGPPLSEHAALARIRALANQNRIFRSFIGMGYYDTITPPVILRNILENPGWYTAYTPYQAEIAQGRLEALLNFQTVCIDLTGLPVASASLLDEGTAAAEAMAMSYGIRGKAGKEVFFVSGDCHPQTIDVVRTRAEARGITVVVAAHQDFQFSAEVFGALLQYPATDGAIDDHAAFCERAHGVDALVTVATDLLALAILTPPGEWGADVAVGNTQRFGVPLGFGGPHAAFFTTRDEFRRHMPGRIIGVSRDRDGRPALRMALQTREQHIRREKATSNVCTAQVLLAVIAGAYAVWHGPEGLIRIARRIHGVAASFAEAMRSLGHRIPDAPFFDTVRVFPKGGSAAAAVDAARKRQINIRSYDASSVTVSFGETSGSGDLNDLYEVFGGRGVIPAALPGAQRAVESPLARTTPFLTHPVFSRYRSETEMLRYLHTLESRDLSLTHSMIPLGSCTMKLNATAEMIPVTWPAFGGIHPFAPPDQWRGYAELFAELERSLSEITGFDAVSLQPNAGSQGEFAGLLVIRRYHEARGESHRNICLIPQSAHGTNPASAVMAGMRVVVVRTDARGEVDLADLRARAEEHRGALAALMVTYPSTHGVFEESIREVCAIVHEAGGQVYMDGANMNAMVGLCRPGDIGADVCHLNLHKTFCIPHGGGGPGMGPIACAAHLSAHLPEHRVLGIGGAGAAGAVSAAPFGSASILPISWMYVTMMGGPGLKRATEVAILNANYLARVLEKEYAVLYKGTGGMVAHECIVDTRPLKAVGVEVEDIAKRLMDYGFHAPTVSFPVAGTLMIEPTESESKAELDRFAEALLSIREEVREVEEGKADRENNVLRNSPHPLGRVISGEWTAPYSREKAVFPLPWVRERKFWPHVGRIDSAFGDRNLVCACPPIEEYDSAE
jgi:glycine dehydrogenase